MHHQRLYRRRFFCKAVVTRSRLLLEGVGDDQSCVVPECTGLWWRYKPAASSANQADSER